MNAEVFKVNSNYKLDINIIQFNDDLILTTIPKNSDFSVFFSQEDEVIISIYDDQNFYLFNSNFSKLKSLNHNHFFQFKINHLTKIPNKRKEFRQNVNLPAIFNYLQETAINFATILDISETGMRIETNRPIHERQLSLSFDKQKYRQNAKAEVVWSKVEGKKFLYGLQFA